MQFQHEVTLDPLQKYQKTNSPPYKAVVGLLLVFFTTVQTLTLIHSNVHSNVNQIKSFTYLYFDPNVYQDQIFVESQHFHIRDTEELITQFDYLFNNLNNIRNASFQKLSFDRARMNLYTYYQTYDGVQQVAPVVVVNISEGQISEPFNSSDPTSIQNYLFNVSKFEISISDIQLNVSGINTLWTHKIIYQFDSRAELKIALSMQTQKQSNYSPQDVEGYYYRQIVIFYAFVILLAVISLYLNYRYFTKLALWLIEYSDNQSRKKRHHQQQTPQYFYQSLAEWIIANDVPLRRLSFSQWLQLVDIWIVMSTIGNACQIIGTVLQIFSFRGSGIVGVGCMIAWFGVLRYLRYIPRFTVLNSVLAKSLPKMFVFMAQFVPSFFGFLIFATSAFWKVEQFSSAMKTMNVQMCMMLGDSIEDFTNQIAVKKGKALAMFYTFGFVLCFMHAIHNLLTALIKENFITHKIQRARKKMEMKGLSHKTSIQQIKPSYQQLKTKIQVDYSIIYQNQMIRKQVKGIIDTFIYKIQKSSLAINHYHKKLQQDFRRELKYGDLISAQIYELRAQMKQQLKKDQVKVEMLKAKLQNLQS